MLHDNEMPAPEQDAGLHLGDAKEVSPESAALEINLTEAKFDPNAAVDFASRFGLPNVMKITNGPPIPVAVPTREAAIRLIESDPTANFYFCPAAMKGAFAGIPKKTDCLGSEWVRVDIDPPKGMTDAKERETWLKVVIEEVRQMDLPFPQIIVFSGRGLWLYWRLRYRLPVADVEAINYALVNRFGGDAACWNVNHIARLPFTRNSKTDCISSVIYDVEGYTDPALLPSEPPPTELGEGPDLGDIGPVQPLNQDQFRKLIAGLPCGVEKQNALLLAALDPERVNELRPDKPLNIHDRSAVMFSWAIKAINAGMQPCDVRNCILSTEIGPISAHLLDPKKYPPSLRHRAAKRQVQRAYAKAEHYSKQANVTSQPLVAEEPDLRLISLAPVPDDLPARSWLVEGLLMDGCVTMLTGRGGEGKSMLALQLATMVASGTSFAWWESSQQRKVMVLNGEDDLNEQRRRLLSACSVMGTDHRQLENRLYLPETKRLALIFRDPEDNKVKNTPFYETLKAKIKENDIGFQHIRSR